MRGTVFRSCSSPPAATADYHEVTDEPQYIDYEHLARVANFVHDVALRVANLDHRPVVDHPKPDPMGQCVQ